METISIDAKSVKLVSLIASGGIEVNPEVDGPKLSGMDTEQTMYIEMRANLNDAAGTSKLNLTSIMAKRNASVVLSAKIFRDAINAATRIDLGKSLEAVYFKLFKTGDVKIGARMVQTLSHEVIDDTIGTYDIMKLKKIMSVSTAFETIQMKFNRNEPAVFILSGGGKTATIVLAPLLVDDDKLPKENCAGAEVI